jgi:hypothetical protein
MVQAKAALIACGNNVESAVDWLFSHPDLNAAVDDILSALAEQNSPSGALLAKKRRDGVWEDRWVAGCFQSLLSHARTHSPPPPLPGGCGAHTEMGRRRRSRRRMFHISTPATSSVDIVRRVWQCVEINLWSMGVTYSRIMTGRTPFHKITKCQWMGYAL